MYGTRVVARNLANEYAEMFVSIGFVQGKVSPCAFKHEGRGTRTFVHGGDYVRFVLPHQLPVLQRTVGTQVPDQDTMVSAGEGVSTRGLNIKPN